MLFRAVLIAAACKALHKAGGAREGERKEEEQYSDENCAQYACGNNADAEKKNRKQRSSQNTCKNGVHGRAEAAFLAFTADSRSDDRNGEIYSGNAERNPEECRSNGDDRSYLKKSGNNADNNACDNSRKGAAEFAVTITVKHRHSFSPPLTVYAEG